MKLRSLIAAAALCTLCVGQASALEYTVDAPEDYLFGTPTSEGTVYEQESNNVDRGKNTALIPPGFGTATSYLPGSGAVDAEPAPRCNVRRTDQLSQNG